MKKSERDSILKWGRSLTHESLEREYYNAVYNSLGSEAERMNELGYDIADIVKREKYERFLCEKANILEELCNERGIKLWNE